MIFTNLSKFSFSGNTLVLTSPLSPVSFSIKIGKERLRRLRLSSSLSKSILCYLFFLILLALSLLVKLEGAGAALHGGQGRIVISHVLRSLDYPKSI